MTDNFRKMLADVFFVLKNLPSNDVRKVPKQFFDFIEKNKDNEYIPEIDSSRNISKQHLSKNTWSFLAMVYYNYWCDDFFEKNDLRQVFAQNEFIYKSQLLFDWS